jgi:hypothetical protein
VKKPKAWSVTKEEQLVTAIIKVNQLCSELQLPELLPMRACQVILTASRERGVEALREFPLRVAKAASKLVQ